MQQAAVIACRVEITLGLLLLNRAADTVVGSAMMRGISGGEKKRVTTGEMLVGAYGVCILACSCSTTLLAPLGAAPMLLTACLVGKGTQGL